jgi:hypothetical protein
MPKKRAAYPKSGARLVRRTHRTPTFLLDNEDRTHLDKILLTMKTLAMTEKLHPAKTRDGGDPAQAKNRFCQGTNPNPKNEMTTCKNYAKDME